MDWKYSVIKKGHFMLIFLLEKRKLLRPRTVAMYEVEGGKRGVGPTEKKRN